MKNSFDFIRDLLENTGYRLIYLPKYQDEFIDITKRMAYYDVTGLNEKGLKKALHNFFTAPEELIQVNSNIELGKIVFIKSITEEINNW